jgi:hypothetical protein
MKALGLFTNRGLHRLLKEGGSQAWKLNPERAKKFSYVVCAQNREDGDWGQPTHEQGEGFLIAKIRDVVPSPEGREGRYIVLFDEYAELDKKGMAYMWRNPVRYIDLDDYKIDPNKLTFQKMPPYGGASPLQQKEEPPPAAPISPRGVEPMDIATAKKALAAFYKVPSSAIEITIRG